MIAPAMILTRPSALLWGLAAVAIVLLYLRPIRPARARVATGRLWLRVLGQPRTSAAWWRRRRVLSAAIHMATLGLVVLAAADPLWNRPRTVVLLIDNSLGAPAAGSQSNHLPEAKQLAQTVIAGLGQREFGAVISTAGSPVLVCNRQSERERLAAAVDRLTAVDRPTRMNQAVRIAAEMAAPGTQLEIHAIGERYSVGTAEDLLDARSPGGSIGPPSPHHARRVAPVWPWAVCAALLLMAAEWALYHRRWTC